MDNQESLGMVITSATGLRKMANALQKEFGTKGVSQCPAFLLAGGQGDKIKKLWG